MPLTGSITYGYGACAPTGAFCAIGLDGKHYIVRTPAGGIPCDVGCAETNTITASIGAIQWLSDFQSLPGAPTGTLFMAGVWGSPGTSKFCIMGFSFSGYSTANDACCGCWYEIAADGSVGPTGDGFCYSNSDLRRSTSDTGFIYAEQEIDGSLYVLTNLGTLFFGFDTYLVKVPISGVDMDFLTPGTWESAHTRMHPLGVSGSYFGSTSSPARFYTNRATIVKDPSGIGVFDYSGFGEYIGRGYSSPTMSYCVFAADLSSVGSMIDRSSDFGIPFGDSGKTFAGSASTNGRDEYGAPSLTGSELIMGRSFSDARQTVRGRRYVYDEAAGDVTLFSTEEYQGTADVFGGPVDQVQFSLEGGTTLNSVMDDETTFHFGAITVIDHETPPDEDEEGAEDEDDFRAPCDVIWPQCGLVPQAISVNVTTPSVSPGRAFSGAEQLVQAEAGFWTITYENVPVKTKAEDLLWREIESKVNGRAGVICVPVYEGKLSSTPIAATVAGDWDAGAVYIGIEQTAGATLRAGMQGTAGEWLYRIKAVLGSVGDVTSVKIWPPLREAVADGLTLDFNTPTCRCRLATDQEMDLKLGLLRFGSKTINFVEDV